MATTHHEKKLYTLEKPSWLDAAGMSKGIYHDRQHLGIILAPGETLVIRQANPDSQLLSNLKLRLLNYDSQLEQELDFSGQWVTATNNSGTASVPFVDTPFGVNAPTVQYEYPSNSKILPTYQKYDSESDFFALWDSQAAEFGLVISDYVQILVPASNKEDLRHLKTQPNIDGLIEYFDRILTFYNELSGLSFEPTKHESDRNIPSRYFLKADAHGAGGAYYSGPWCAESQPTIRGFWLDCQDATWGNLHEIGHGYQGGFMNTHGFDASEVWNNIYAATFQNAFMGDKIWTNGWLYDYGNSNTVFAGINDLIAQGTPLATWGLREKLVFLVLMKDRAGNTAFTHFNKRYRKECNDPTFVPGNVSLLDMLSESYGKISKIDVTPFIILVGGKLTDAQIRKNVLYHERAVYPLNQLVGAENLEKIQTQLNARNPFTLVDPTQLKVFGIGGDLEITFNIQDFKEIYGETFTLMEGQRYAYVKRITTRTLTIPNVPIGVYTIVVPTGKSTKYTTGPYYAISKEGGNKITIDFTPKKTSWVLNSGFNVLGISNGFVASVKVDYVAQVIQVDVTNKDPHSYFAGKDYAKITILNASGVSIFDKVIQGTKVTLLSQKIPFELGYTIKLWHAEPDRLRAVDAYGKNDPFYRKDNSFTIKEFGVVSNDATSVGGNDIVKDLLRKIGIEAAQICGELRRMRSTYDIQKDDLYMAIRALPDAQRAEAMTLYRDVIPTQNMGPGPLVGQTFTIKITGLADNVFSKVTLDLVKRVITFENMGGVPHSYFNDTYAFVRFVDANGVEEVKYNFIGDQNSTAETKTFALAYNGGETLTIHHKEASTRLIVDNEMQVLRVPVERNMVYALVYNGLEVIRSSSAEGDDPKA